MGSLVRKLAAPVVAVLLGDLLALPAAAQATQDATPEAPQSAPASATFALGFSRSGGERSFTAWIYSRQLVDQSPDGIRGPKEFLLGAVIDGHEVWRSSADCPQIIGVLMDFDRMMPAVFSLPPLYGYPPAGANARAILPPPPDAPGYRAWGPARQADSSAAYLSVSAGTGYLAETIERAEASVRPCFESGGEAQQR